MPKIKSNTFIVSVTCLFGFYLDKGITNFWLYVCGWRLIGFNVAVKTAVPTKIACTGLKTAPFCIFSEQLKTLQTANAKNHQKKQNLITFKTFFNKKNKYQKLA